ncbi:hypothetical protein R1CP_39870 (plasmid) [Rhodococcus opacus]|uniref:Uncharacterized protein n=1 Tax=Rhodococcus opacus TaxID=37919 RepID=A0A1B1KIY0_RHOOP|nr:hypothetical protein R1CP_39870 [Rhodococcus opacus]
METDDALTRTARKKFGSARNVHGADIFGPEAPSAYLLRGTYTPREWLLVVPGTERSHTLTIAEARRRPARTSRDGLQQGVSSAGEMRTDVTVAPGDNTRTHDHYPKDSLPCGNYSHTGVIVPRSEEHPSCRLLETVHLRPASPG